MKYRVTSDKFFGTDGKNIPAGTTFTTSNKLPADWVGMVEVVTDEPDDGVAISNAPTREGIAAMGKDELLELLDAHGWDGDKRLGVEKLRDALTEIMFIGV